MEQKRDAFACSVCAENVTLTNHKTNIHPTTWNLKCKKIKQVYPSNTVEQISIKANVATEDIKTI